MRSSAIVLLLGSISGVLTESALGQCNGQTQYAQPKGTWSAKYDWFDSLLGEDCRRGIPDPCQDPDPNPSLEIAHAALIPKGMYAGYVLLWRERQSLNGCRCQPSAETYTWIMSPTDPSFMIRIEPFLPFEEMCSGMTWDPSGRLVIAGGGNGPESVTYRFRPGYLTTPTMDCPFPEDCDIYIDGPSVWQQLGDMEVLRYYPMLMTLLKDLVYGTGSCSPNPIPGGSVLALGGPDLDLPGQEYWELLPPAATQWTCPILPENPEAADLNNPLEPSSPHYVEAPPSSYDEYVRPGPPYAERLLDSYPRAYVMSNKEIFIEGDVDTWGPPQPNDPGASWVIRPKYGSAGNWELVKGPYTNGQGTSDPSYDRYYAPSVLLHTLSVNGLDRLLVIGGSYDANYFTATPVGSSPSWVVNDTIREFVKATGAGQDPFVDGNWRPKITDATHLQRVWHNAVILPTGQILIVGGSSTDHPNHFTHAGLSPVFEPVIYDPGADAFETGAVYCMEAPDDQPANGACAAQPIARLYHSVAALLQDGRVLVAGGHWLGGCKPDSRLNGEIFSPPYLHEGWRPVVSAPGNENFGESFNIEVDRRTANSIDRVVLLRPAAVSHHNDYDQRYIELAFSLTTTSGTGSIVTDTLSVTAPGDNLGPPGFYILFAIEAKGSDPTVRVPSIGSFLKIQ